MDKVEPASQAASDAVDAADPLRRKERLNVNVVSKNVSFNF